jgi:carbon storage regulator
VLVLSRRLNEAIVLPGLNVTVRVVAITGGQVRIGIEAPRDVEVFRAEVLGRERAADNPLAPHRSAV